MNKIPVSPAQDDDSQQSFLEVNMDLFRASLMVGNASPILPLDTSDLNQTNSRVLEFSPLSSVVVVGGSTSDLL